MSKLLRAARSYQRRTRQEPGNLRCELHRTQEHEHVYLLFESFRDEHVRMLHAHTPHASQWREALAGLVTDGVREQKLEAGAGEVVPPPLPLGLRPAVEASSAFGAELQEKRGSVAPQNGRRPQLTIHVEAIEVAAARDHLPLRAPQPCVVLGAFVIDDAGAHGTGRTVYRFGAPKSLPGHLIGRQRLLDVPVLRGALPLKLALVLISVEENGGRDVQRIYQTFADGQELPFWTHGDQCPSPLSLSELQALPGFADTPQRVHVLQRTETLSDALDDDTWAGAALACFELTAARPEVLARFHTASEDRVNDWLLTLRCRIR